MTAARKLPDLTRVEDFLAWVWRQPQKFELIDRRLVMMAGGSRNHAAIAANAIREVGSGLKGGDCLVYTSDFLVVVGPDNRYYPDLSVACGETRDYTDRAILIVEVLSPTTWREDMGAKLANYLRCPGLRYLLYLWQDQPRARLWRPQEDGGALPIEHFGLEEVIELDGLGLALPMAELYRSVDFKASETF